MKKKIIAGTLTAALLSLGVLAGCTNEAVGISAIEKSGSVGLVDYYTITYTDGTTSQFTVTNGKDGADAQEVTAEDVYATYKQVYNDDELTFAQFCDRYLSVNDNSAAALNACLRSCLKVYSVFSERTYTYGPVKPACYCGSGVVYKMEEDFTYFVTNYHVVYDYSAVGSTKISTEISAYMYGSESAPDLNSAGTAYEYDDYAISCQYIGGSIDYDVAVIRAKTEDVLKINPQVVPVAVNLEYNVGDNTFAVGNPGDLGLSVTEGIISVDSEYTTLAIDNVKRSYRSIRTDTALTHGSSGGGLFNMAGELIGLNNSGSTSTESMNYAIPASILKGVADGVIHYYNANGAVGYYKTQLGIRSVSNNSRYVYDADTGKGRITEDVTVTEVTAGSLASSLGLQVDDVIRSVTVNGETTEITRQFQIADLLLSVRAGDKIRVGYERDGEDKASPEVTVTKDNLVAVN